MKVDSHPVDAINERKQQILGSACVKLEFYHSIVALPLSKLFSKSEIGMS